MDIFERLKQNAGGPIGQYQKLSHGYYSFPKLEGEIGPHMIFRGREVLNWSLNNYLGLANHPEVRKADAEAAAEFGMAYPMGARMMSGQTKWHEQLERELAAFVGKPDAFLLNYGYQGMISIIDSLLTRRDVVVYDSEAHACIIDGLRLHTGKRFVYPHNDMEACRKQLAHATKLAEENGGGVLVITEGVFGMKGDLGKLDEIVAMKKDFNFRLLVDDAHGFGTMGKRGSGTPEHFGVTDGVDVLFNTFAKSMAGIGAFVSSEKFIVDYLRYNMRSQARPDPHASGVQGKPVENRPCAAKRLPRARIRHRRHAVARHARLYEGRRGRSLQHRRRPARDLQPVLLGGRLPGDPQGRNHPPHHPDGRAHARRRELHARLLREMSQETARRRIQKAHARHEREISPLRTTRDTGRLLCKRPVLANTGHTFDQPSVTNSPPAQGTSYRETGIVENPRAGYYINSLPAVI